MDKKQQNVRQAKTLSEYANIAFPRDKTVCMLDLFRFFQFGVATRVWWFQCKCSIYPKNVYVHKHTYVSANSGEILAEMKWNKKEKWTRKFWLKRWIVSQVKRRYESFDGNCDRTNSADLIGKMSNTNKIHHLSKPFFSLETDFRLIFVFFPIYWFYSNDLQIKILIFTRSERWNLCVFLNFGVFISRCWWLLTMWCCLSVP